MLKQDKPRTCHGQSPKCVWCQLKISIPWPMEDHCKFWGGGGWKDHHKQFMYELKLWFPEGGRVQTQKTSLGGVWIFPGTSQWTKKLLIWQFLETNCIHLATYIFIDLVFEFHSFVQGVSHVELNQFHQTLKLSSAYCEQASFTFYPAVLNLAFRSTIKHISLRVENSYSVYIT